MASLLGWIGGSLLKPILQNIAGNLIPFAAKKLG
jgi:hypothetical protein